MITFTFSAGAVLETLALISSISSSQVGEHPEIPALRVRGRVFLDPTPYPNRLNSQGKGLQSFLLLESNCKQGCY